MIEKPCAARRPRLGKDVEGNVVEGAVGDDRQPAVAELAGNRAEEQATESLAQA